MARRKQSAWDGWQPPSPKPAEPDDEASESESLADKPEPAPWTHLEPLFPQNGTPFTPTSPCPHRCKLCSGAGGFVDFETGETYQCPDCAGSGQGKIPAGSAFVCMVCHQAGKDGHRALPIDVEPLPLDPPGWKPTERRKPARPDLDDQECIARAQARLDAREARREKRAV